VHTKERLLQKSREKELGKYKTTDPRPVGKEED
jgi:hypothetical protein